MRAILFRIFRYLFHGKKRRIRVRSSCCCARRPLRLCAHRQLSSTPGKVRSADHVRDRRACERVSVGGISSGPDVTVPQAARDRDHGHGRVRHRAAAEPEPGRPMSVMSGKVHTEKENKSYVKIIQKPDFCYLFFGKLLSFFEKQNLNKYVIQSIYNEKYKNKIVKIKKS